MLALEYMLTLLLGPDDFSKTQYIDSLSSTGNIVVEVFTDVESTPQAENLASQDLFSKPKIFVLRGLVKKYSADDIVEKFISSKNNIIIVEEKLDKRSTENKALLANKSITTKEFNLPHGEVLDEWIIAHVKKLGGKIESRAASLLAQTLGRDNAKETKFGGKIVSVEEVYNLWQVDSEVRKLIAYAGGQGITEEAVKNLVFASSETDVFELTNAIAENQKEKSMVLMQSFLKEQVGSDEKGAIIQLNALLSEQFRNVAMIQSFINNKASEDDILDKTGWKSGRLFVIKKIAARFNPKKILELLNKLAALDEELKTSSTPPKVLLDLIISQLFQV